ncbi:MAG: ATP-dependent RecD-like DNA helicase [Candidatus Promineifilaceae bacterium]
MDDRAQISGSVERVTYYNEENGYSVIRLKPDSRGMLPFKYASGREALITVVGNLPEVNPGEWLRLTGQWATHARHGRQFQVEICEKTRPATVDGIRRYLGSGMIRGIGPVMAERIVNQFGEDTLEVIDHQPERLREVVGIGQKRILSIVKSWEQQRAIKEVMLFLQSHGVSTNLAVKIYKTYGDEALQVVQQTPYRLVKDVYGIGFRTADQIAQALGMAHDDPARIEAGVAYTLNRMADDGHVYMPQEALEPEAAEILGVPVETVSAVIEQLESSDFVKRETLVYELAEGTAGKQQPQNRVGEERAVYLTPFYYSEVGVTNRMRELVESPGSRLRVLRSITDSDIARGSQYERADAIRLSNQQITAIRTALTNKVTVLTGGPGTGKTTTLRALLDLLEVRGFTTLLASPTGRAAKRLSETTGREAKTIHRLLEFKPGEGFGRNEHNPLQADMVVIDEASMLDLNLANHLLKAIPHDSHLLLVGDVDQLPSVGAGDILRDLIASGVTAVLRLETIFRQASGSLIIRNAHRINQGQMPETPRDAEDFFLFVKPEPDEAAELLIDIVASRVPQKFGLDPLDDIQVLSPMYNGQTGVTGLNQALQARLNPPGKKVERRLGGRVFRVGDKVMQTVNNYDKNVYNGDIGRITAMDTVQQTITISIDGEPVVYDFLEADELVHAFAISVHKSQGAEYPCIVMPVTTQHYLMLQRNLLYTAVTRAKRLVILVGTRKALAIAVKNNQVAERYTALDYRLQQR